jgi:branched-chain amino acid transport system substrate-binding protein
MRSHRLLRISPGNALLLVLFFGIFNLFVGGCNKSEPIRIGFVAQLTGFQAELGVQERNGVQLAIEQINAAGGLAGCPLELVVRDDLGTSEGAQNADRELIEADVVAIIGHATSSQTIAGLAITNPAKMVMLSPTTTTPALSGKDDFFFRITCDLEDRAGALAQRIYHDRHLTKTSVIYDSNNIAYSKAYLHSFAGRYNAMGGALVGENHFSSQEHPDFAVLIGQLQAGQPDCLVIIAADIDTALIAQRARLLGWQIPLFTTSWAQTKTLIDNGGQAVEGMEIEIAYSLNDQSPAYLNFQKEFHTRFGQYPSFGGALGFETAKVLAAALQKTGGKSVGLRQALIATSNFQGLTDTFSMDQFGDINRPFHLGTIRGGKYVDVKAVTPALP